MSSATQPLVAITGATGAQGGSVVKFLVKDGGFRLRAITRNTESSAAKSLAAQGVEVVRGDFDDPASITEAFNGADAVFAVTNYWGLGENAAEKEVQQGKMLVDIAKATQVKHFIWSTVENTGPVGVKHADSKALVNDYLIASGLPRTSLYTTFYFENFIKLFKVAKTEAGTMEANWPIMCSDGPLGAFAVEDTGAWVLEILKDRQKWINNDLAVAVEVITPRTVVKTLEKITGKTINLHEITMEAFETMKDTPYHELYTNMKFFYVHNGTPGKRDTELSKSTYPQMQKFKSWAQAHISELVPQ